MSQYIIFTDSGCDIFPEVLEQWGVRFESLTFRFEGEDREYLNYDMPSKEFYDSMRAGKIAKTAALNIDAFKTAFEQELKKGNDILYLGFSGGLSNTCNAGILAANELAESYPERKIIAIDTLAASAGQGLLVYMAVEKKNSGATLEETADYIRQSYPKMAHWFTVDDLVYLKRGGRVSAATAVLGAVLNIKPVLHVDNEGHLISMVKARGRKAAINTLAAKMGELCGNWDNSTVFICHADALEDAQKLAAMVKEKYAVKEAFIGNLGAVIGSHAGPGTLALFFMGNQK